MGEPAWAIATLFPAQGDWSEEAYLGFSSERPTVELVHGDVEVLPMPTDRHQRVLDALFVLLLAFMRPLRGIVRTAGIRVRLGAGLFRQPDIVLVTAARLHLRGEDYWTGADIAVEVVSGGPDDRVRDLVTKRREYAEAGIPEYWIVEPDEETVTVLRLEAARYVEHGRFGRGTVVGSHLLPGLTVAVDDIFDAP